MNGEDIRARAEAEARLKKNQRSHAIAHDVVDLIKAHYPDTEPGVVFGGLASVMAMLLVMLSKGDAEALAGTEYIYRILRTDVIGMLAVKRERDGQATETHS